MKKYYVGIDYHKRYSVASAVDEEGRREAEARIEGNNEMAFRTFFERFDGEVHVVLEVC